MQTNRNLALTLLDRWKSGGSRTCIAVLLSFGAGSSLTAGLMRLSEVRAESNRVFELNVYHAVPGRVPALESRFRKANSRFAKHGLNIVAYWVPQDDPSWANDPAWANTFVYVVAHPNWEDAGKNWKAFHDDPEFQVDRRSEQEFKLIEKVDKVHMRPTDFSPMN